jgi:hypothetical protein
MVLSIQEQYEMSGRFDSLEEVSLFKSEGFSVVTDNNETFYLVKDEYLESVWRMDYNKVS